MRSEASQQLIEATKRINIGKYPLFIQMAHRALEKGAPEGTDTFEGISFVIPKDIMNLSVSNPALLEPIERIEFIYRKPPA